MGLIKVKHRGLLDGPATVAQIVREVMAVSDVPEIAHLDVKPVLTPIVLSLGYVVLQRGRRASGPRYVRGDQPTARGAQLGDVVG